MVTLSRDVSQLRFLSIWVDRPVVDASARLGLSTNVQPRFGSKIDRFGAVVTSVEAGMITVGISEDKLSGQLDAFVNGDTLLCQLGR